MREQITFAVDANRMAHYVGLTPLLFRHLSIADHGASIDEWPGDFPGNFEPGFYSAILDVTGPVDHPVLRWSGIQKLTAYPPWAKVTKLPLIKEEKTPRIKKKATEQAEPTVRIRRKGEVLI